MPQIHPFLFAAPRPTPDRSVIFPSARDPQASSHLEKALHRHGFDFGTPILNFPPEERNFDLLPVEALYPVQLPFLEEGSLLFQATRPPLSDGVHGDRKKVEPSNTTLERATFHQWWRYFDRCSRSCVTLRDEVASFLPDRFKNRQDMTFHQKGCSYKYLQEPGRTRSRLSPEGDRTAAFFLRVDQICEGGPGLAAAWGLNAISTQAWCRMLRYRYPHLLEGRGLTMVELTPAKQPARSPTDAWMGDWTAEIVFEMGFEMPPRPEEGDFAIAF